LVEQRLGGLLGRIHHVVSTLAGGARRRHSPLRQRMSPIYGHLLHALSAGRGVRAEINGQSFRLDPRFRGFIQPDYEADLAAMLRARMTPGQCCLDVGAHVGIYALQIARWTAPGGRLIAFEPNPGTAGVLRRHLRMNRLNHAVQVEEVALGATPGRSLLFGGSGSGLSRLASPNPDAPRSGGARTVAVSTVDDYCGTHAVLPDWLLIDVEGFEFEVLAGATETIRARGRSLSIVLEIHPTLWPLTGWTASRASALFASLGRRPVPLVGQRDVLADYGSIELAPVL